MNKSNSISKFNLDSIKHFSAPHVGVDEVGRGCLAGPVVAAAVYFNSDHDVNSYIDSKKLTEEKRELLFESICRNHSFAVGWSSVEEIDELNILQASLLAMYRAVEQLKLKKGSIFVDGRDKIPNIVHLNQKAIVKGDQHLRVISAASIVAKVTRDRFMKELSTKVDAYGFEKHKGYGTAIHRSAIQKHGASPWHRRSFSGVKEFI